MSILHEIHTIKAQLMRLIHKHAKYIHVVYKYLIALLYFMKADRILVQNARNLMTVVLKAMTAAESVCVKVGINQFIHVYPLTSSIPIISTNLKQTKYIHYHVTYQLYQLPYNIPIKSTTIILSNISTTI